MTGTPRFSVTIPAYNAEDTLGETVESVRAQTFPDWELVIVDDGSTDSTRTLAEEFAARDSRIRVISQENRGSGGAYNTAVRNARSDLIVMLSADDLLLPEHLERFDAFIAENPDADIFSSGGYYDYDDGVREVCRLHKAWADESTCAMPDLLRACFFDMGTVYRKEIFEAVGGFREDIFAEDYLFFVLAFAKGYRHRHLDIPLAIHHRTSGQKSANAILVRQSELRTIREVMATGLLSPADYRAARRAARQRSFNILVRKVLGIFLGAAGTTRLINRIRRRHP